MEEILKKGGSIIVVLSGTNNKVYAFEDLTPVNFWSTETNRLQR